LGRRVEKIASDVTASYTYDGADILRQATGSTAVKYVNSLAIDEVFAQEDSGGAQTFLHADGLGSIIKTTDSSGAVLTTRRYDAFGNLELDATSGYAFTGREWDTETGLYYYRARYYDAKIGRFVSEDPLGFGGDQVNLFSYVANNPPNLSDPSGLLGKGHGIGGIYAPWGYVPPSWQRRYEPISTYYGAEGHFFVGTGLTSVTCTDECGHDRTFRFIKVCLGGAVGAGASGGRVMGMSGKKCRADNYRGWFYEAGA